MVLLLTQRCLYLQMVMLLLLIGDVKQWLKLLYQCNHTQQTILAQDISTSLLSNIASENGFMLFCNQTMVFMITIDLERPMILQNSLNFMLLSLEQDSYFQLSTMFLLHSRPKQMIHYLMLKHRLIAIKVVSNYGPSMLPMLMLLPFQCLLRNHLPTMQMLTMK